MQLLRQHALLLAAPLSSPQLFPWQSLRMLALTKDPFEPSTSAAALNPERSRDALLRLLWRYTLFAEEEALARQSATLAAAADSASHRPKSQRRGAGSSTAASQLEDSVSDAASPGDRSASHSRKGFVGLAFDDEEGEDDGHEDDGGMDDDDDELYESSAHRSSSSSAAAASRRRRGGGPYDGSDSARGSSSSPASSSAPPAAALPLPGTAPHDALLSTAEKATLLVSRVPCLIADLERETGRLRRLVANESALRLFDWQQDEVDLRVACGSPIRWLHPGDIPTRSLQEVQARLGHAGSFMYRGRFLRRRLRPAAADATAAAAAFSPSSALSASAAWSALSEVMQPLRDAAATRSRRASAASASDVGMPPSRRNSGTAAAAFSADPLERAIAAAPSASINPLPILPRARRRNSNLDEVARALDDLDAAAQFTVFYATEQVQLRYEEGAPAASQAVFRFFDVRDEPLGGRDHSGSGVVAPSEFPDAVPMPRTLASANAEGGGSSASAAADHFDESGAVAMLHTLYTGGSTGDGVGAELAVEPSDRLSITQWLYRRDEDGGGKSI